MQLISIDQFLDSQFRNNQGREKLKSQLQGLVKEKANGAKCVNCGNEIWVIGSALSGSKMCFACITGETDDSNDYEVF